MAKIQQGSMPAYEVIYDRYNRSIWNFVRLKIRNEERALEISQDILLKIFHSASLFKTDQKFRPWLWAMVRNIITDEFKKKDALSVTMEQSEIQTEDIPEEDPSSALDGLMEQAQRQQVEQCLNNLTENQKEAISLQIFSELSLEEIATEMKVKVGAVKSLIFRGKEALKKCLEKCL
ncbi:MAG: hypothetical protein Fur0010_16620 [Bdellovibrio sp.]